MVVVKETRKYYTKDKVSRLMQERVAEGLSVKAKDVRKSDATLYIKGLDYFGSWEVLLGELGISWDEVYDMKPNGYWTKEKIRVELMKRVVEGKGIDFVSIREEDIKLYYSLTSVYGSWSKAIEAIGENVEDHLQIKPTGYWTREAVLSELRARRDNGLSINPSDIRSYNNTIGEKVIEYFGNWEVAYNEIGEEVKDHTGRRMMRSWSKGLIIGELKKRRTEAKSVRASDVHRDDIQLYRNGLKYYGTWSNLMEVYKREL